MQFNTIQSDTTYYTVIKSNEEGIFVVLVKDTYQSIKFVR